MSPKQVTTQEVKGVNLDYALADYLSDCRMRGLTPHTIADYESRINLFCRWLKVKKIQRSAQMKPQTIKQYVRHLQEERKRWEEMPDIQDEKKTKLTGSAVNAHIRTIRPFLRYLYAQEYTAKDLADVVKPMRTPSKEIEVFTEDEVWSLINAPDNGTFLGLRDSTIMHALYGTGARISELMGNPKYDYPALSLEKINVDGGCIILQGKGRKERWVPLGTALKDTLRRYLAVRTKVADAKPQSPLFINQYGDPYQGHSFYKRLRQYADAIELECSANPHKFRHTYATHYLMNGGDVFSLKAYLGHTSLSVTNAYVNYTKQYLQIKADQHNPLDYLTEQHKKKKRIDKDLL